MTNRQKNGIGCFIIALIFAFAAAKNTFMNAEFSLTDEAGLGASRLVGAFLPSVVFLGLGVWLFQKPKPPTTPQ